MMFSNHSVEAENQWSIFSVVTAEKSSSINWLRTSEEHDFYLRKSDFIFDHIISIRFRSELYGGR